MNFNSLKRRFGSLVAVSMVIGLVVSAAPASASKVQLKTSGGKPRVVVAVIDTGINPYHEYFHARGTLYGKSNPSSVTPQVLREFGIGKDQIITITRTGNFAADYAKDKAQFDKIKKGKPYWFKGTNIIGISFSSSEHLRPDGNASAHGIGTAAAVLTANPEAVVVAVESWNDESEAWAFSNPAVDIVSTSYGPATSAPTLNHLSSSYTGVVENGKAHFGAAANDPTYATLDETAGPWWSIGVAGYEEGTTNGRQMTSGSVADFVGDFTQELPYCRSCEMGLQNVGGTSFATPRSAGTFSKILLEARRALGHGGGGIVKDKKKGPLLVAGKKNLDVWQMRRALEEAAYYPGEQDYSPGADGSVPVVTQAPWYQMGWGLITPDSGMKVVPETLAHLGVKGKADRTKPQEACDFMTANMEARRAYWEQLAVLGDGFGKSEDPYLYC